MHVTLIVPTLNRLAECKEMIASAVRSTRSPDSIIVIDNSCGNFEISLDTLGDLSCRIIVPNRNLGVALSWNLGISCAREWHNSDYVLVSNDDVTFYEDTIEKLIDYAVESNAEIVYPGGVNHQGNTMNAFSVFLTKPEFILDTIGGFDVGFKRGYYEDNAMARLMYLGGYRLEAAPCSYDHIGSATLHALTPEQRLEHDRAFEYNKHRYIAMWGGEPHNEVYTTMWNGDAEVKARWT